MTTPAESSGYNSVTLNENTVSAAFALFEAGGIPLVAPTLADATNAFLAGFNFRGIIGPNRYGSFTVATTEPTGSTYVVRVALERDVELALVAGPSSDEAVAGVNRTLVARAAAHATLEAGKAELDASFNASTGFSEILLRARGQDLVTGDLFELPATIPRLRETFGRYEVPRLPTEAALVTSSRAIASSSALPTGTPIEDEITPISEVTVTTYDFGVSATNNVGRLLIDAEFHREEAFDRHGKLIYFGYHDVTLQEGVTIAGYLNQVGFASHLVFLRDGARLRPVWALGFREFLADSIANATTYVLGERTFVDVNGIFSVEQGLLVPTVLPASARRPEPPKPEPKPCPPKPEPKPCPPKPEPRPPKHICPPLPCEALNPKSRPCPPRPEPPKPCPPKRKPCGCE